MRNKSSQHTGISRSLLALACLLGSIASSPSFAYTFIDLGADVAPKDINNLGIVVGSRNTAQYPASAFRYTLATGQLNGQNHGFLLVNGDAPTQPSSNIAPVAVASADVTAGKAPLTVNFTGINSSDPDGDSTTYHWDFGDSTPASTDASPMHTYNDPGTYPVLLTVSDSQLENSAQLEIRVRRSNGGKK